MSNSKLCVGALGWKVLNGPGRQARHAIDTDLCADAVLHRDAQPAACARRRPALRRRRCASNTPSPLKSPSSVAKGASSIEIHDGAAAAQRLEQRGRVLLAREHLRGRLAGAGDRPQLLEVVVARAGNAEAVAGVPAVLAVGDLRPVQRAAVPDLDQVRPGGEGKAVGRAVVVDFAVVRMRRAPDRALQLRVPDALLQAAKSAAACRPDCRPG